MASRSEAGFELSWNQTYRNRQREGEGWRGWATRERTYSARQFGRLFHAPERVETRARDRWWTTVLICRNCPLGASRGANGDARATGDDPKDGAQDVRQTPKNHPEWGRRDVYEGVLEAQSRREVFHSHEPTSDDVIIRFGVAPKTLFHLHRQQTLLLRAHRGFVLHLKFKQNASIAQNLCAQRLTLGEPAHRDRSSHRIVSPSSSLAYDLKRSSVASPSSLRARTRFLHQRLHLFLHHLTLHLSLYLPSSFDDVIGSVPRASSAVSRSHRPLRSPRRAAHGPTQISNILAQLPRARHPRARRRPSCRRDPRKKLAPTNDRAAPPFVAGAFSSAIFRRRARRIGRRRRMSTNVARFSPSWTRSSGGSRAHRSLALAASVVARMARGARAR